MVILGLGSNLGNRRANLTHAIGLLAEGILTDIRLSPLYETQALLTAHAPKAWDRPFLNMAVVGKTHLEPIELLQRTQHIEKKLGRDNTQKWSPRPIDVDMLAWDHQVIYSHKLTVPHAELLKRPFALLPLTNLAPHWPYPLAGKYQHIPAEALCRKLGYLQSFDTITLLKPSIVGILNITPDSFSDGGQYLKPSQALAQYQVLVQQGASIIDIGAESTRPHATLLNHKEEWARIEPVLEKIGEHRKIHGDEVLLSLDTRHAATLAKALRFGIHFANDVSGLYQADLCRLIAQHNLKAILMHTTTIPAHPAITLPEDQCPVEKVLTWAKKRIQQLTQAGINPKQLIFDPGIGFGKTPYQSLKIIHSLQQFTTLGCPIMLGHSRKSFMQVFTQAPARQRDFETALIAGQIGKMVDYLRVHNVQQTHQALVTSYFTSLNEPLCQKDVT